MQILIVAVLSAISVASVTGLPFPKQIEELVHGVVVPAHDLPLVMPAHGPPMFLHAANGPKPFIQPSWSANITTTYRSGGQSAGSTMTGVYYYDAVHQRTRQIGRGPDTMFAPTDVSVADVLTANTTGLLNQNITLGSGADAVCKPMTNGTHIAYQDPFYWLASTSPNGTHIVGGEPCDVWAFETSSAIMTMCIAHDGAPREVTLVVSGSSTHTVYSNVRIGLLEDAVFMPSAACATNYPTPACPDTGVVNLDLYRIHGAREPLSLTNRNVADALGDVALVCLMDANDASYVSRWVISANSSWGQYSYCLYSGRNVCYSGSTHQVGRESSLGMGQGHLRGQCSENSDVGNWFSLPEGGECAPGEGVGTRGCTWGGAKRLRTVAASCILQNRGLQEACSKEMGHAPFQNSAAIFRAALASDDPNRGGCPDVGEIDVLMV